MNYKDILAMAEAYKMVSFRGNKKMDPVDADELKGSHADRADKDIDNDGDADKSDEYLHKRRKAVSKAIKGKGTEIEVQTQESVELDEISKTKMGQYIKRAHSDKETQKKRANIFDKKGMDADKDKDMYNAFSKADRARKKAGNRTKFIGKAVDKLTKEANVAEKVDLDEVSQETLRGYHAKAGADLQKKREKLDKGTLTSKDYKSGQNRVTGLNRSANKMEAVAMTHGNMTNGSPRGEGLSPSAKKELDRTTPMNPATDVEAVNTLNFKTFKDMTKKAAMRAGDSTIGDKTVVK
jgi:hypothetical protein